MSDLVDIRPLLASWPYDPEDCVRTARGADGREILQVRTPLGLEQLELAGRPDGARPHGCESALEFHQQRLAHAQETGQGMNFELSADDCAELFSEGTLFYLRYLHLFQLKRWSAVVRDTTRNLRLFDFVHRHAAREEDQSYLEKWRPYLLRMKAAASASLALEKGDVGKALTVLLKALDQMAALEEMDDETFHFERERSQDALRELLKKVQELQPISPLERLERQLRLAVEQQEFERAATLRDRIRELKGKSPAR